MFFFIPEQAVVARSRGYQGVRGTSKSGPVPENHQISPSPSILSLSPSHSSAEPGTERAPERAHAIHVGYLLPSLDGVGIIRLRPKLTSFTRKDISWRVSLTFIVTRNVHLSGNTEINMWDEEHVENNFYPEGR